MTGAPEGGVVANLPGEEGGGGALPEALPQLRERELLTARTVARCRAHARKMRHGTWRHGSALFWNRFCLVMGADRVDHRGYGI